MFFSSTLHHRARLIKYYPRQSYAPSFVKSRMLRPLQTHFLLFQQIFFILVCIHAGNPRVRGQLCSMSNDLLFRVCMTLVLFRDSLLPRPENGPGTQARKERVLYYLQAHARNEPIRLQKIEQRRLLSDWLLKIVASSFQTARSDVNKDGVRSDDFNLCFFHRSFYTLKAVS